MMMKVQTAQMVGPRTDAWILEHSVDDIITVGGLRISKYCIVNYMCG